MRDLKLQKEVDALMEAYGDFIEATTQEDKQLALFKMGYVALLITSQVKDSHKNEVIDDLLDLFNKHEATRPFVKLMLDKLNEE